MTLETKKTIALIGSALAAIVVIAGNILMAIQIKIQGSGFYVSYLFYSLAILAVGEGVISVVRILDGRTDYATTVFGMGASD